MIALPLALSLSSSVTEVGAIAAFAALLGIAILSLLVFSQAREIKRLREWAGRGPERAAEMEQRVSADAASRMQRAAAPGGAVAPARVVPRKTPLVSAPVSTAVNATVAAAGLRGQPASSPEGASSPVGEAGSTPDRQARTPGAPIVPMVSQEEQGSRLAETSAASLANGAGVEEGSLVQEGSPPGDSHPEKPQSTPGESPAHAPATAAARAAVAPRAPLPPSPDAPAPPGSPAGPAPPKDISASVDAVPFIPATQSPNLPSRPPAPIATARRTPSRAVGASGSDMPTRSPPASRGRAAAGAAAGDGIAARSTPARGAGVAAGGSGPKYFKQESRSPGRAVALIVGGVLLGVVVLVLAVSALKGSGGSSARTAGQKTSSGEQSTTTSHRTAHATTTPRGETAVVVLNGTSTEGLAHHLASDLQQSGYSRALALAAVPPGTHATTVVQYTHGHRADAQAVAKALNATQSQPIEPSTASLAGSATVVVLAGADQATQLGGGGAQSKGEPAAGAGGESAAGSG